MKKMLRIISTIVMVAIVVIFIVCISMFTMNEPEIMGIVTGVIMSVGLAYLLTMLFLLLSNLSGDTGGTIKDFTKEPVEFL